MIDEQQEELASLYVLGMLEPDETRTFEAEMASKAALRSVVDDLRESTAQLAHGAPRREPPSELEGKILSAIGGERKIIPMTPTASSSSWVPWALAAGLAITSALLFVDRAKMSERLTQLQHRDFLTQAQIATLSSKLATAPQASAVIVWDEEKQQGVMKVVDTPATSADKDYQLWIVDPKYPQPVNGGVFGVDRTGATKISFKPDSHISSVKAFAVSLERKGGVPKAEGPMILVGQ